MLFSLRTSPLPCSQFLWRPLRHSHFACDCVKCEVSWQRTIASAAVGVGGLLYGCLALNTETIKNLYTILWSSEEF